MTNARYWLSFLVLAVGVACADEPPAPNDFTLPQLKGDPVSLSDYRGQWVVVNYWAIWCKPCVKEIPDLAALHDRREDVTVLGLAFDESDPAEISEFYYAISRRITPYCWWIPLSRPRA